MEATNEPLPGPSTSPLLSESSPPRAPPRWGLWLLAGTAGATAALLFALGPFLTPVLRGALALPYVPANPRQIAMVLEVARARPGRPLVDLGSGDGRVVLAAARAGIPAVGVELNWTLVLYARWQAWRQGLWGRARFVRGDLWATDLRPYGTLVVFGVREMMPTLEAKLARDMPDDAVLVACRFRLPTWTPTHAIEDPRGEHGLHSVWVYPKQGGSRSGGGSGRAPVQ
jgi:hypothetical protein